MIVPGDFYFVPVSVKHRVPFRRAISGPRFGPQKQKHRKYFTGYPCRPTHHPRGGAKRLNRGSRLLRPPLFLGLEGFRSRALSLKAPTETLLHFVPLPLGSYPPPPLVSSEFSYFPSGRELVLTLSLRPTLFYPRLSCVVLTVPRVNPPQDRHTSLFSLPRPL